MNSRKLFFIKNYLSFLCDKYYLDARRINPFSKKILLLNYSYYEENWGCRATSNGLIKKIRAEYPLSPIKKIPIKFERNSKLILPKNPPKNINRLVIKHVDVKTKRDIENADIVILNGEGTMHEWRNNQDHPEPYIRLLELAYAQKLKPKKTVASLNQTVDFTKGPLPSWIKDIYGKLDIVYVREKRSLKRLKGLGLYSAKYSPDAAFLTSTADKPEVDFILHQKKISKPFICVFFGESSSKIASKNWVEILEEIEHKYNCSILLFAAPENDKKLVKEIKEIKDYPVVGIEASPSLIVGILRESELVISGRFHCCIFAALAGKAFVPIESNTDKITSLCELLSYNVTPVNPRNKGYSQILKKAESIWKNRKKYNILLSKNVKAIIPLAEKKYGF